MPIVRDGSRRESVYEVGLVGTPPGPVERRVADDLERNGFATRIPMVGLSRATARPPAPAPITLPVLPDPEETAMPSTTPARPAEPLVEDAITAAIRELVAAANVADDAWIAYLATRRARDEALATWQTARDDLAARLSAATVELGIVEAPAEPSAQAAGPADPSTDIPGIIPEPASAIAPRRQKLEERVAGLSVRQAKAIAALRAGKTRAEAARELGVTYQTIDGLLEAAGKKGLLPAELFAALPARFAKYARVPA